MWKYHQECSGYTWPNQVKIFVGLALDGSAPEAYLATVCDWPGDRLRLQLKNFIFIFILNCTYVLVCCFCRGVVDSDIIIT